MVRSMEIYDPRLGKWMTDEPLNRARGYSATAILNESIHVIGGADTANGTVDNVRTFLAFFTFIFFLYTTRIHLADTRNATTD